MNTPLPAARPLSGPRGTAGIAYAWLRGEILSGRMRPGAALSENATAQQLGVSRTPVREAIIRLENEGLVVVRPQVGTSVSPIDLEAVADGQFVREAIECKTVALAARRVTAADARELRASIKAQGRLATRRDHAGFLELDDGMHRRLVAMSGRPRIWRAVEDVKSHLDRVRFLSLEDPDWLATIHAQHEDIVRHVLAGAADAATAAMSVHLHAVFASVEHIARVSPEYFFRAPASPVSRAAANQEIAPARRMSK